MIGSRWSPRFPIPLCCSWLRMRGGRARGGGCGIPGTLAHSCLIVPRGGAGLLLPLTQSWEHSFLLIHAGNALGPAGAGQGHWGDIWDTGGQGWTGVLQQPGQCDLAVTQGSERSTLPPSPYHFLPCGRVCLHVCLPYQTGKSLPPPERLALQPPV